MKTLIEENFPYDRITRLALKERRKPRPYHLIHPWPARRPGILFRALILASLLPANREALFWKYLLRGGVLEYARNVIMLDPFMGSGTSLFEALSLGLKVVGVDINTIAWFIVKTSLRKINIIELENVASLVLNNLRQLADKIYVTRDPETGNKVIAKAYYWVKVIKCQNCGENIELF